MSRRSLSSKSRRRKINNSARKRFTANELSNIIADELESYSEEITIATKEVIWDVADRFVGRTRRDAPTGRRKGRYKKAIASKTAFESKYKLVEVWYVRGDEYRLAHLLNNGHAKRNGKGFVKGDNHISKNEEIARKELEQGIEAVIKNGY